MNQYKLNHVLLAAGCLLALLLLLAGCANLHTVSYKWDVPTGKLVKATYTDDTGWRFFSNGAGKTIEISPSVNGIGL